MSTYQPINNLPYSYAFGCQPLKASNTTLTIGTGQVRDSTNSYDIVVSSPLTLNFSINGANGLDTGTIAANTGYYIFAIYDPSLYQPVACLASLSPTSPLMPTVKDITYGALRLIGWVLTDGSSNILSFSSTGNGSGRKYQWDLPLGVLTSGTATAATVISLATAIPSSNFGSVQISSAFTPVSAGATASIKPTSNTNYTYIQSGIVASVVQDDLFSILPSSVLGVPELTYILSSASSSLTLKVVSFDFNL